MSIKKLLLLHAFAFVQVYSIDVLPETEDFVAEESMCEDEEKRGMLPVPTAPNLTAQQANVKLVSPTDLGKSTSTFGCCKVFQLTRSLTYSPTSEAGGSPMIHITGKGATFDMAHNCVSFNRSGTVSNSVGIEVGYSPNNIGSLTQVDSVTIENGILCNWDIGILVHSGVRNITLKNLVLTNNTIPIAMVGESDNEIVSVYLENVFIVGNIGSKKDSENSTGRLEDLKWIRAKLTDGTAQDSGPTAANPSGYSAAEVMSKECDPVADTVDTAYVYTGIFGSYIDNIQLNNVSVSNIGFDGDLGGGTAESSAAYGIWLKDSQSIFMEDVEATRTLSAMTSVGLYLDACTVISIKNANFSNNFVTDVEATGARTNCRAGRWAAAVVLKDVNDIESCDVVLSNTQGIDRTWAVRVILNPVTRSNSFAFENVMADFLRGDEVIGFDLGDTLRNDSSGVAVPPGAIRKLRMKNISISSARGLGAIDTESNVATFFKGIHLGDGSKDITLEDVRVESNSIALAATGVSSGIEFGGESTTGTGGANGTGKASGTIQNIAMKNVSISGNTGGGAGNGRFVGIRAQATGTTGGHTVDATNNLFEDIVLQDVYIKNNQFDGIRFVDDTGESTPIVLQGLTCHKVACNGSLAGAGLLVQRLRDMEAVDVSAISNASTGFQVQDTTTNVSIDKMTCNGNGVGGISFGSATLANPVQNIIIKNGFASGNTGSGIVVQGNAQSNIQFHNISADKNTLAGVNFARTSTTATGVLWKKGSAVNNGTLGGIRFAGTAGSLTLQDLIIKENGSAGVTVGSVTESLYIDNSVISENAGAGILATGAVTNLQLYNSHVDRNTAAGGISCGSTVNGLTVKRSTLNNNIGFGCSVASTATGLLFEDAHLNSNSTNGLVCATTTNGIHMLRTTLNNNGQTGLLISGGSASTVMLDEVTINNNAQLGFSAPTVLSAVFKDLVVSDNGTTTSHHGINVSTSLENLVADNITVTRNTGRGILATSARHCKIENFAVDSNATFGIELAGTSESVKLKNGLVNNTLSATAGISAVTINGFELENVKVEGTNGPAGIRVTTAATSVVLQDVHVSNTESTSATDGILMQDLQNGLFEKVTVASTNCTSGANAAHGMRFTSSATAIPSVRNITLSDVKVTGTTSTAGSAAACQMNGGIGITAKNINFSKSTATAAAQRALGWHLLCRTGQGFSSVYVDGFTCNNQSARSVRGLYVENPGSMTAGIRTIRSAEFKNGTADHNVSTNGLSHGIDIDYNSTATTIGSSDLLFENVSASQNSSVDGNVAGITVQQPESITFRSVKANNNSSSLNVGTGPFSTHGILLETSVDNLEMYDVTASGNVANNGNATGVQVDKATVVHADGVKANDNRSETTPTNNNVAEVRGIYFKASVGSEQSAGCVMNNLQACGNINAYRAYGIHLQEPTGVTMEHVDASSNKSDQTGQVNSNPVLSQAAGVMIEGGKHVHMTDVYTSVNTQAETTAANLLSYVATGPTNRDETHVNGDPAGSHTDQIARNYPVASRSGAYGVLAQGVQSFRLEDAVANANEGVRAFGVLVRDLVRDNVVDTAPVTTPITGHNPMLRNVEASHNHATGGALNTIAGTNTAMTVPDLHAPTIFGGLTTTETVDLVAAYTEYLKALSKHATEVSSGTTSSFCTSSPASGTVSEISKVSAMAQIIWAILAQFRRFSTSVGIGVYNCDSAIIDSCKAIGNNSDKDGAAGIALYGCGNKGHMVQNCTTGYNQSWTDSERENLNATDATGTTDISEWASLYSFIGVKKLVSEATGPDPDEYTVTALGSSVATSDIAVNPTLTTQPGTVVDGTWAINQRKLTAGFGADAQAYRELYNFSTVVPTSVGIALEAQRDSHVLNNHSYSNHGHAGLAFGILSDSASTTMFQGNKATANESDAVGYAWGLADLAYSTPNVWFKNWMYANRVDVFLNSSLLIAFDSDFSANQTLPLTTVQPGATEQLARASAVDNMIIEFLNCRQIEDCIGDCVKQTWEDLSVVTSANTTPYPDCSSCV